MAIQIRKAEIEDISSIQYIAKKSWNDTYKELIPVPIQEKFLKEAYSDEFMIKRVQQSLLMVAEDKVKLVGFANAFIKGNKGELSAIYLLPEVQRQGIGSQLLEAMITKLNDINEIYVEVEKGNLIGERFYEAKGFKLVREYEDDFYGHTLQTKRLILNV